MTCHVGYFMKRSISATQAWKTWLPPGASCLCSIPVCDCLSSSEFMITVCDSVWKSYKMSLSTKSAEKGR